MAYNRPVPLILTVILSLLASGCMRCPQVVSRAPEIHSLRAGFRGLINPLLDLDPDWEFLELRPFKHKVQKLLSELKGAGKADHISVYFRDLNSGPIFGFDEKENFSPASLLKVPLMMAALRVAEEDAGFLSRTVVNDAPELATPNISGAMLEPGKPYSLDELLRAMIAASDNQATILVKGQVPDAALSEVYKDLGLLIPEVRTPEDSMSVREYGTFFRILYNASYLDRRMSQKALEYLAASQFQQALVAGVAPGTVVAHKFGERSYPDKKIKQLHDCGIVYHSRTPYLLCVMTRGSDFSELISVIRDVSSLVYTEVDAQAKP